MVYAIYLINTGTIYEPEVSMQVVGAPTLIDLAKKVPDDAYSVLVSDTEPISYDWVRQLVPKK